MLSVSKYHITLLVNLVHYLAFQRNLSARGKFSDERPPMEKFLRISLNKKKHSSIYILDNNDKIILLIC